MNIAEALGQEKALEFVWRTVNDELWNLREKARQLVDKEFAAAWEQKFPGVLYHCEISNLSIGYIIFVSAQLYGESHIYFPPSFGEKLWARLEPSTASTIRTMGAPIQMDDLLKFFEEFQEKHPGVVIETAQKKVPQWI